MIRAGVLAGVDRRDAPPLGDRAVRDGALVRPSVFCGSRAVRCTRRGWSWGRTGPRLSPITLVGARLAPNRAALAAGIGAAAVMAGAPDDPPGWAEIAVSAARRLVVRRQWPRRLGAAAGPPHRQGDGGDLVSPSSLTSWCGPSSRCRGRSASCSSRRTCSGWASCSCRFPMRFRHTAAEPRVSWPLKCHRRPAAGRLCAAGLRRRREVARVRRTCCRSRTRPRPRRRSSACSSGSGRRSPWRRSQSGAAAGGAPRPAGAWR